MPDCPYSDDGRHRWDCDAYLMWCLDCGRSVAVYVSAEATPPVPLGLP